MTKRLLVVDGDEVLYKAAFGSQYTEFFVKFSEDNIQGPFQSKEDAIEWIGNDEAEEIVSEITAHPDYIAIARLKETVEGIVKYSEADDYILYLTGKDNFRNSIATLAPYKENRKDSIKPLHFSMLKDLLLSRYRTKVIDGMEADDALSISSWRHYNKGGSWEVCIASQDKDLNMVPGLHYNPRTKEVYSLTPNEARHCFYKQLLTGDRTDNIPGLYRIGNARAEKALEPFKTSSHFDIMKLVKRMYQEDETKYPKEGVRGEERITEVARLLWMLQEEGQLWSPDVDYYEGLY